MNNITIFVGLDTAKTNTEVACAEVGHDTKPTLHSKIKTTKQGIEKLVRQLQSKYPGARFIFVYLISTNPKPSLEGALASVESSKKHKPSA